MKFMVRQKLDEDGDVMRDHVEPLAGVVAASLEDPPSGPVVWLSGCGTVDTKQFYMLFEAPDRASIDAVFEGVPGVQSIERVMAVDQHTLARGLLLGYAANHKKRQQRQD